MNPDQLVNPPLKESFRRLVGRALGLAIPPKGFEQKINELDNAGKFQGAEIRRLLVVICNWIEDYEVEKAKLDGPGQPPKTF